MHLRLRMEQLHVNLQDQKEQAEDEVTIAPGFETCPSFLVNSNLGVGVGTLGTRFPSFLALSYFHHS